MISLFFPFNELVDEVYKNLNSGEATGFRECIIYGARGIGKTSFLKALKARDTTKRVMRLLEGKSVDAAAKELKSTGDWDWDCLLLDDVDRFLEQPDAVPALEFFLANRGTVADANRKGLVSTSSILKIELMPKGRNDLLSNWIENCAWRELQPWMVDWKSRIRASITSLGVTDQIADRWVDGIEKATGGHPSLVGAAINELHQLLKAAGTGANAYTVLMQDGAKEELYEQFLRERLMLGGGMTRIIRAIRDLPAADRLSLQNLAKDEGSDTIDNYCAARLLATGLAYRDKELALKVVPGLIKQEISRQEPVNARPTLRHRPDTDRPEESGVVEIWFADRLVQTVPLSGTQWKLLHAVFSGEGATVSTQELQRHLGADKGPNALNSALQRLRQTLEQAGLKHVIESVRNEGYRKAPVPPPLGP